jgi:hypothetical protein
MRFLGQTEHGIYGDDPMDDIHPETINCYYGVHGAEQTRLNGQTGAGHAEDEDAASGSDSSDNEVSDDGNDDAQWAELQNQVAYDQSHNVRHKPVKVPRHHNPFAMPDAENEFQDLLSIIIERNIVPAGFGVSADEWDDGYPELETIKTGSRGKELEVVLPEAAWLPQAILWSQALDLMSQLVQTATE